eukprot:1155975-Pelagomonas_calceolata.AAC.6
MRAQCADTSSHRVHWRGCCLQGRAGQSFCCLTAAVPDGSVCLGGGAGATGPPAKMSVHACCKRASGSGLDGFVCLGGGAGATGPPASKQARV